LPYILSSLYLIHYFFLFIYYIKRMNDNNLLMIGVRLFTPAYKISNEYIGDFNYYPNGFKL